MQYSQGNCGLEGTVVNRGEWATPVVWIRQPFKNTICITSNLQLTSHEHRHNNKKMHVHLHLQKERYWKFGEYIF